MDVALLLLRVVVGLYVFAHGAQKLFGWFGGGGLAGTRQMVVRLRFRPTLLWTVVAGVSEAGGLLFAVGLLTPLAAAGIASAMLTAILSAHLGKGWFAAKGGPELPLTNLAVAIAIVVAGAGRWSLDAALGIRYREPATAVVVAVLVIAGVALAFATRRPSGRPAPETRAA